LTRSSLLEVRQLQLGHTEDHGFERAANQLAPYTDSRKILIRLENKLLEGWLSGSRHLTRNQARSQVLRGFESHPFRHCFIRFVITSQFGAGGRTRTDKSLSCRGRLRSLRPRLNRSGAETSQVAALVYIPSTMLNEKSSQLSRTLRCGWVHSPAQPYIVGARFSARPWMLDNRSKRERIGGTPGVYPPRARERTLQNRTETCLQDPERAPQTPMENSGVCSMLNSALPRKFRYDRCEMWNFGDSAFLAVRRGVGGFMCGTPTPTARLRDCLGESRRSGRRLRPQIEFRRELLGAAFLPAWFFRSRNRWRL
jgi:hypothetical protein